VLQGVGLLVNHRDRLGELRPIVEGLAPQKRSVQNIVRPLSEKLGISLGDARSLVVTLLSFHQLRETFSMSPPEAFDAITRSLEVDATDEWRSKNLEYWKQSRARIEDALSGGHPLYVVQKNIRLKYEHANILRDASIVVDARPVFNESGSHVEQWAIDYVLQVEYHDGDSIKRLYATLDVKDLEKLGAQCRRALLKTKALKTTLASLELPVVVTGEDDE
jgi:hypothetical protein